MTAMLAILALLASGCRWIHPGSASGPPMAYENYNDPPYAAGGNTRGSTDSSVIHNGVEIQQTSYQQPYPPQEAPGSILPKAGKVAVRCGRFLGSLGSRFLHSVAGGMGLFAGRAIWEEIVH